MAYFLGTKFFVTIWIFCKKHFGPRKYTHSIWYSWFLQCTLFKSLFTTAHTDGWGKSYQETRGTKEGIFLWNNLYHILTSYNCNIFPQANNCIDQFLIAEVQQQKIIFRRDNETNPTNPIKNQCFGIIDSRLKLLLTRAQGLVRIDIKKHLETIYIKKLNVFD